MTIEIANRLCAYRKMHGLSQEELAEKIGVSRQAVSKWERAEASPDTDNLILLSQIYGVTLDDLLNKDPNEAEIEEEDAARKGIDIDTGDGDYVHIGLSGIEVESKNGDSVHIGFNGIRVNSDGHIDIDENGKIKKPFWKIIWSAVPWSILCCIVYLVLGFFDVFGGWTYGWLVFLTIPIYSSLGEAILKRDACEFCYPVLVTLVYLILGFALNWWHPGWILFLTIPVYYPVCSAFKKLRR